MEVTARDHPGTTQRQFHRIGAAGHADAVRCPYEGGVRLFEPLHPAAADERGGGEDLTQTSLDLGVDLALLGGQVNKWDRRRLLRDCLSDLS